MLQNPVNSRISAPRQSQTHQLLPECTRFTQNTVVSRALYGSGWKESTAAHQH